MTSTTNLYFSVEGGATLELARKYVADRLETMKRNAELIEPLGVTKYVPSLMDGTVVAVQFDGKVHPDFKKPNKNGSSFPTANSEWSKKFAAQTGYDRRGFDIAKALGVPTDISFTYDGGSGSSAIAGLGFDSGTGFLYPSKDGPFALYVPNVEAVVARHEARGHTVCDACKNFKPEFDGARPMLKEEWDLVIARYKLAEAEKAAA